MIGLGIAAVFAVAVVVGVRESDQTGSPPAVVADWIPPDSDAVAGMSWSSLATSEPGRQVAAALRASAHSPVLSAIEKNCAVDGRELLRWVSKVLRAPGVRPLVVMRLSWCQAEVERCLRKLANAVGGELEITGAGPLREYTVEDESAFVLWLAEDTAAIVDEVEAAPQQARLAELQALGNRGAEAQPELAALIRRIDSDATFWLAMVEPPAPTDPGWNDGDSGQRADWYRDQLAGLLGATPKGFYGSLTLGDAITVRGGARYATPRQAQRVAERARRHIAAARAPRQPPSHGLDQLSPELGRHLEPNLDAAYAGASQVLGDVLDRIEVEVEGEFVIFSLHLGREQVERLLGGESMPAALRWLDRHLPDEFRI